MRSVVFFGDSLTRADYLPAGFVDILAERCPDVPVINQGVNGDTSADLLQRVHRVRAMNPDRVYLLVGTNDCGWGLPPAEYRANLEALVAALRPAELILITPTTSLFDTRAIRPYAEAVRDLGRREGLSIIDFAAAIQDSDYGWDGLHWNQQGHQRLADLITREEPLC